MHAKYSSPAGIKSEPHKIKMPWMTIEVDK